MRPIVLVIAFMCGFVPVTSVLSNTAGDHADVPGCVGRR